MKSNLLLKLTCLSICLLLGACASYVDRNGQVRQGLTPVGSAIAQAGLATGVGVGTGALMKNQPSWLTGGASGLTGNVASQVLNAFVPTVPNQSGPAYPPAQVAPARYAGVNYDNGPLYRALPNGEFVRVQ